MVLFYRGFGYQTAYKYCLAIHDHNLRICFAGTVYHRNRILLITYLQFRKSQIARYLRFQVDRDLTLGVHPKLDYLTKVEVNVRHFKSGRSVTSRS